MGHQGHLRRIPLVQCRGHRERRRPEHVARSRSGQCCDITGLVDVGGFRVVGPEADGDGEHRWGAGLTSASDPEASLPRCRARWQCNGGIRPSFVAESIVVDLDALLNRRGTICHNLMEGSGPLLWQNRLLSILMHYSTVGVPSVII